MSKKKPQPKLQKPIASLSTPEVIEPGNMEDFDPLPFRRQLFVRAFVGEARFQKQKAAIIAGYAPSNASVTASKLLRDPRVRVAIATQLAAMENAVTADEVVSFLSNVVRGKSMMQPLSTGEVVSLPPQLKDRISAAKTLAPFLLTPACVDEILTTSPQDDLVDALQTIAKRLKQKDTS